MQEILINNAVHETRVAVLEDGVLQELRIERNADVSLIGNIYLGVVGKVLPGMQSAFVEIGLPRAAFLHVSDMRQAHQENGGTLPIERLLHDGQVVLVQVAKDPIGTKGARLTTEISLAGRLLVYLPYTSHIGVSQKIEDEAERERLKEAVAKLTEEQGIPKGGFIVRTSGEDAKPEDFVNDMKYLEKLWLDIEAKTHIAGAPCLLYSDVSISQRVLRDIVTEQTGKIIVDNPEVFEELQRFGKKFVPEAVELLELYNSERPLFDQYNLEKEIEASLSRRVDLKSGGYLIIDQMVDKKRCLSLYRIADQCDNTAALYHQTSLLDRLRSACGLENNIDSTDCLIQIRNNICFCRIDTCIAAKLTCQIEPVLHDVDHIDFFHTTRQ